MINQVLPIYSMVLAFPLATESSESVLLSISAYFAQLHWGSLLSQQTRMLKQEVLVTDGRKKVGNFKEIPVSITLLLRVL